VRTFRLPLLIPLRALSAAVVLALAPTMPFLATFSLPSVFAAQADDDDDDDDDDGGGGGGSGSGGSGAVGEPFRPAGQPVRRRAPPAREQPPPPVAATDEIVVRGLDTLAEESLLADGYVVLRRADSGLAVLRLPSGVSPDDAVLIVQALMPGGIVAANAYYRPQATPCEAQICASWEQAGLTAAPPAACMVSAEIGIVDTGVNVEHDMLEGATIVVERFGIPDGAEASSERHGTAIVAMFVGDPDSRVPGMLPGVRLRVADPFARVGSDERSDTFALVAALDTLIAAEVAIINLSLAGPDNALVADAVARAGAAGIPLVAAVGNEGPQAPPLYPAGYASVIAVTAVDGRGRVYRRAGQGEHVDLAAPGVAIPTAASVSGVRPQTGTSFAVPFVTVAMLAEMQATPEAGVATWLAAVTGRAVELGEPGRDPVFGHGLVQIGDPCAPTSLPLGAGEAPIPAG
jgi:hypothetical protein